MRARLAASQSPRRIFDVVLDAARAAGAVSPRRVLDSAPIYDAVATEDTVTMLRSAIRQTLAAADAAGFGPRLRAVLRRDDDYASGGKAVCDWEDPAARGALVAELAEDASAVLEAMRGRALGADAADAAELLAAVSGQDLEAGPDNKMRIARRVAEDRVISTTDPDARHGRKSTAGGFDGYKGHIAVDPDSELITDTAVTAVTAGNAADASAAAGLIKDLTNNHTTGDSTGTGDSTDSSSGGGGSGGVCGGGADVFAGRPVVYGDSAYGSGEFQQFLRGERINSRCRTQKPAGRGGLYSKDRFDVDVHAGAVTCPAGVRVEIRLGRGGDGAARFGAACDGCEQRRLCTEAKGGRTIRVSRHEAVLADARSRQRGPGLEARLPRHAPQSRAQARPPQTPLARRPKSPRAGPAQSRRRLQPAGRRRQLGAPRRARPALPAPEMGPRLTTTSPHPPPNPSANPYNPAPPAKGPAHNNQHRPTPPGPNPADRPRQPHLAPAT